jgi:cell wall-associated NlpC family hydrolase
MTADQRAAVVAEAKTWLRTAYHHKACIKGAGADCAMFPLAVYRACGLIPESFVPPDYSPQWHLHQSEEIYLQTIAPLMRGFYLTFDITGYKDCGLIPESSPDNLNRTPQPADFVIFKFGRTFSHGAIVVQWPVIIHSYIPHGVQLSDALADGQLIGRDMKFFELI